ncbi:hypothetical protein [Embleya sp. NBC_00896]|uniref:hypothetical protein n=1 Tax=Embleya sp. NBC_00896 TaxID=2975961 RepID=UPI003869ED2E|nr:hypothetical protein OG928_45335 [Embleya sp. NBC_00896]
MTDLSRLVNDPSAWAPIHKLAGRWPKPLPGIFAADYIDRLDAARHRLRKAVGSLADDQDTEPSLPAAQALPRKPCD